MDKKVKLRLRILIGLVLILAGILLFYTIPALSWEEITLYDYQTGGVSNVTSYSKWDSQSGTSCGYIHVYRSDGYLGAPLINELERQELRREEWWGDEYKEWLYDQGLTRGDTIGW